MGKRIAATCLALSLVGVLIAGRATAQFPRERHDEKTQEAMHMAMDADKILRHLTHDRGGHINAARNDLHDAIKEMKAAMRDD